MEARLEAVLGAAAAPKVVADPVAQQTQELAAPRQEAAATGLPAAVQQVAGQARKAVLVQALAVAEKARKLQTV